MLFCVGNGDWGWIDVNIDKDGEQLYELEVPETPDDFWFNVFCMRKENGIGLTINIEPKINESLEYYKFIKWLSIFVNIKVKPTPVHITFTK